MTFCGEDTRRKERIASGNIGDGFLLAGLMTVYSGDRVGYDSHILADVLNDGVALIERDMGLLGEYGRAFHAELEAQIIQLPEYGDRIRARDFLSDSKDRVSQGHELPPMPADVLTTMRQMFDRKLSSLRD